MQAPMKASRFVRAGRRRMRRLLKLWSARLNRLPVLRANVHWTGLEVLESRVLLSGTGGGESAIELFDVSPATGSMPVATFSTMSVLGANTRWLC